MVYPTLKFNIFWHALNFTWQVWRYWNYLFHDRNPFFPPGRSTFSCKIYCIFPPSHNDVSAFLQHNSTCKSRLWNFLTCICSKEGAIYRPRRWGKIIGSFSILFSCFRIILVLIKCSRSLRDAVCIPTVFFHLYSLTAFWDHLILRFCWWEFRFQPKPLQISRSRSAGFVGM